MTNPKSQVVSIRLNSEVIRQGELKAREQGEDISALAKRLLIEHLSSAQESKTQHESELQKNYYRTISRRLKI